MTPLLRSTYLSLAVTMFCTCVGQSQQVVLPTIGQQRTKAFVYNVGLNALIGGVGALINKKEHEKAGRVFLKGIGVGGLGGMVSYGAKSSTYWITKHENVAYGWISRLGGSIGSSIVENAASNRDFWASWHLSVGPIRVSLDQSNQYKPRVGVMPTATYGLIRSAFEGRFDFGLTLKSGAPVFRTQNLSAQGRSALGAVAVNSIILGVSEDDPRFHLVFAHEFVHTVQNEDFIGLSQMYSIGKLIKNDWWDWIAWDEYALISQGVYGILWRDPPCVYNNFREMEAEFFASRRRIPICD